jgi:predicted SnoaL-like aldol condensation-catalyzing enzyme
MSDEHVGVVIGFFDALTARDFGVARSHWRDDGVWHLDGQHDLVDDYSADSYVEFLGSWFATYPEYTATDFAVQVYGTDVVAVHLDTTGGRAPATSGLMIFRVDDGLIAEGWAIPTSLQGAQPF